MLQSFRDEKCTRDFLNGDGRVYAYRRYAETQTLRPDSGNPRLREKRSFIRWEMTLIYPTNNPRLCK